MDILCTEILSRERSPCPGRQYHRWPDEETEGRRHREHEGARTELRQIGSQTGQWHVGKTRRPGAIAMPDARRSQNKPGCEAALRNLAAQGPERRANRSGRTSAD